MPDFVDVLPDPGRPLSQLFTYRVPEALRPKLRAGAQVLVPFGKRDVLGIVVAIRGDADRAEV